MKRALVTFVALIALVTLASAADTLYFSLSGTQQYNNGDCTMCPQSSPCFLRNIYTYTLPEPCNLHFDGPLNPSTFRYNQSGPSNITVSGTNLIGPPAVIYATGGIGFNFPQTDVTIRDLTFTLGTGGFPVIGKTITLDNTHFSNGNSTETQRVILTATHNITIINTSVSGVSQDLPYNWQYGVIHVNAPRPNSAYDTGGTPLPVFLNNITCNGPNTSSISMAFLNGGILDIQTTGQKRDALQQFNQGIRASVSIINGAMNFCVPSTGSLNTIYQENINYGSSTGLLSKAFMNPFDTFANITLVNVSRTANPLGSLRTSFLYAVAANGSISISDSDLVDYEPPIGVSGAQWSFVNSRFRLERWFPRNTPYPQPYWFELHGDESHNEFVNSEFVRTDRFGPIVYLGQGSYNLQGSTFANNLTGLSVPTATPEQIATVELGGGSYFFGTPSSQAATTLPSFIIGNATATTIDTNGPLTLTGDILGGVSAGSASGSLDFTGPTVIFNSISVGDYTVRFAPSTQVVYEPTNTSHGIVLANDNTLTVSTIAIAWNKTALGNPTLNTPYLLARPVAQVINVTDAAGEYLLEATYESATQSSFFTFYTNPAVPSTQPYAPSTTPSNTPSSTPASPNTPNTPSATPPSTSPSATPSNTPLNPTNPPSPSMPEPESDSASFTSIAFAFPALAVALAALL